jgi:hypothetical protein
VSVFAGWLECSGLAFAWPLPTVSILFPVGPILRAVFVNFRFNKISQLIIFGELKSAIQSFVLALVFWADQSGLGAQSGCRHEEISRNIDLGCDFGRMHSYTGLGQGFSR